MIPLRTEDIGADFPGPNDLGALAGFSAPTLVVIVERDPFFPGRRTCERATRYLPSVENCVTLPGERHFLSPDGQAAATAEIRSFLESSLGTR